LKENMTPRISTTLPCADSPSPVTSARQPSERLRALMRHAKQGTTDFSFTAVASVLSELYHPQMSLADAMHHLVAAFEEALMEPRYEIGRSDGAVLALLLSPVRGHTSVELFGASSMDANYSVKQFYDSMSSHIFGQLSITRVDWLDTPLK
jgi:hypothetical protein